MFGTPAYAQTAAGAGAPNGLTDLLASPIPLVVFMGILFYFMLWRPQQQRVKQHQTMVSALKRGDTVVLNSGVIGKVTKVEDAELGVEIAPTVVIKVVRSMVSEVRAKGEPVATNDSKAS
jgi:preprotein translocase subunit YajC